MPIPKKNNAKKKNNKRGNTAVLRDYTYKNELQPPLRNKRKITLPKKEEYG